MVLANMNNVNTAESPLTSICTGISDVTLHLQHPIKVLAWAYWLNYPTVTRVTLFFCVITLTDNLPHPINSLLFRKTWVSWQQKG